LIDDGVTPLGSRVISESRWQAAVSMQEIINLIDGMIGNIR